MEEVKSRNRVREGEEERDMEGAKAFCPSNNHFLYVTGSQMPHIRSPNLSHPSRI